jgi:NAD(P)H-dependent FMN reductase
MTSENDKPLIQVIIGSIREGRIGDNVARWFMRQAQPRADLRFELVDLKEWAFPFYNFSAPPAIAERTSDDPKTKAWIENVTRADGYVLVSPEYNYGYAPSLKNALDHAYYAWHYKPVGFVSYGGPSGGVRAATMLRVVVGELQMVPIGREVNIPFIARAVDEDGDIADPFQAKRATGMLDQLAWWTTVLREGRAAHPTPGRK